MFGELCGVCSDTARFAGVVCVWEWLWLLEVSHSSAVSIPGGSAEVL